MAQTRKNSILPLILVLVCAAVMLRSAFTGLEIDEEYALSLGYRLVSGDRLFYDMWEPHQLSSLPAAALLAMFIGITGGTTGVLVFFRLVVLACKAGMSCVFYREFRRDLGKPAALLAALAGSFWVKGVDQIWHGMKQPVWFPYRYSFLFSAVVILLAARVLTAGSQRRRAWGQAAGLTQLELAEKLGVTIGTIGYYERGAGMPKTDNLFALCDILHIRPADLLRADT